VRANQLGRRQHVAFHRSLQVGLCSAGGKLELRVKGKEAKSVAVAPMARTRGESAVAARAEIVPPLARRRPPSPSSAAGSMPQASQCVKTPPGASGSSTISANDRVPSGTLVQRIGDVARRQSVVGDFCVVAQLEVAEIKRAFAARTGR
jgi:hypothetical protein